MAHGADVKAKQFQIPIRAMQAKDEVFSLDVSASEERGQSPRGNVIIKNMTSNIKKPLAIL